MCLANEKRGKREDAQLAGKYAGMHPPNAGGTMGENYD
jgi:hypothetical protein